MELKISDKYRVTGESLNFVLQKKIISKKNPGVETWLTVGYYPTLHGVFNDIVRENIVDTAGELKQVLDAIEKSTNDIIAALQN
jgi:hypothetical protein